MQSIGERLSVVRLFSVTIARQEGMRIEIDIEQLLKAGM